MSTNKIKLIDKKRNERLRRKKAIQFYSQDGALLIANDKH